MVFSSVNFLFVFLPLVLLTYFIVPTRFRNGVLLCFSLIFYAWGEPIYISLMFFSSIVDYVCGRLIDQYRGLPKAKAALISSITINLGLLGIFKYSDFIIANINQIFGLSIPLLAIPLPIGISFYTFQTMSYTIDVYRNETKVQRNIINFAAFVTLFPQLIAGPIVRYSTIAEELDNRKESIDQFACGVRRFITGLAKKVLLANSIGIVWDTISSYGTSRMSVLSAWLGILAFSFQIYFDFSGYSDMAIGLGKMFGFNFLENFNYPYISRSITEFWRRWHISLSTWFKDYVYIPLGGNKKGLSKQLRNIAIVWLLTGIWHGASWNFVVWGAYFCVLLLIEKIFLLDILKKLPKVITHIYTLFAIIVGWTIFAFDNISEGIRYLGYLFGGNGIVLYDTTSLYLLKTSLVMLILLILASTPLPNKIYHTFFSPRKERSFLANLAINIPAVIVFLLSIAYVVDSTYNPFLYFRF